MRSINKVIIIGNLTRDPEMRETPNGQKVTTFGLATNRDWVTKDNQKKSSAEFHECVTWSHLAEICNNHLETGDLIYVEGYLKTRSWDTDDGQKKYKTEIVVQDMIILDKKHYSERSKSNENEEAEEKDSNAEEVQDQSTNSEDSNETSESPSSSDENPIDKDLGL